MKINDMYVFETSQTIKSKLRSNAIELTHKCGVTAAHKNGRKTLRPLFESKMFTKILAPILFEYSVGACDSSHLESYLSEILFVWVTSCIVRMS